MKVLLTRIKIMYYTAMHHRDFLKPATFCSGTFNFLRLQIKYAHKTY